MVVAGGWVRACWNSTLGFDTSPGRPRTTTTTTTVATTISEAARPAHGSQRLPLWRGAMPDRLVSTDLAPGEPTGASGRLPRVANDVLAALRAAPGGSVVLDALAGRDDVWVVGGAVRDALLGRRPKDLDLLVEGNALELGRSLGEVVEAHERFGTATVHAGEAVVNVAAARTERYPAPGALPDVTPATLAEDLARRDFTVNAVAVDLGGRAARRRRRARRSRARGSCVCCTTARSSTTRRVCGGSPATPPGWGSAWSPAPRSWRGRPSPAARWAP